MTWRDVLAGMSGEDEPEGDESPTAYWSRQPSADLVLTTKHDGSTATWRDLTDDQVETLYHVLGQPTEHSDQ